MAHSRNRHLLTTTDRLGRPRLWWSTHTLHGFGETEEAARADYAVTMEALRASGLVHAPLGEPRLSSARRRRVPSNRRDHWIKRSPSSRATCHEPTEGRPKGAA